MRKKSFFILFALLGLSAGLSAQHYNLYGIHNSASMSPHPFTHCDLNTDSTYDQLAISGLIMAQTSSSTIDTSGHIYYFCDGSRIVAVNMQTNTEVLNMLVPFFGDFLTCIQYNPCDSLIYGLGMNYMSNQTTNLYAFDPRDSSASTLATCPGYTYANGSCGSINLTDSLYLFLIQGSNSFLGGYNYHTGILNFLTPPGILPGFRFSNMAFDCMNDRVVGMVTETNSSTAYLASMDLLSGSITQISSGNIPGASNPFTSGSSCIDHATGIYYFQPTLNTIYELDLNTGNLLDADTLTGAPVMGLEAFSECACPFTLEGPKEENAAAISVYPVPSAGKIQLQVSQSMQQEIQRIRIYNAVGECIWESRFYAAEIYLSAYPAGVYSLVIDSEKQHLEQRFILAR